MSNWKDRYFLWFSRTFGSVSPFMFTLITLITYLLSCYSCFDLPWLAFAYLSLHLTVHRTVCVDLSTYVRDSVFSFLFVLCTNHFLFLSLVSDKFWYWDFPPQGLVSHFLLFSLFFLQLPFNPSRLHFRLQPACFTCLSCSLCGLCSLRLYGWVGLKGRVCVLVRHTQSLSTVLGRRAHARVSQLFPGSRPSKRQGTLFFSPLTCQDSSLVPNP